MAGSLSGVSIAFQRIVVMQQLLKYLDKLQQSLYSAYSSLVANSL
jgi:hypothetical protein